MLYEWALAIYIIMPDNSRYSRLVAIEKPQKTQIECNKLKLKPSNIEIITTYKKLSPGDVRLVCIGLPKKTEV